VLALEAVPLALDAPPPAPPATVRVPHPARMSANDATVAPNGEIKEDRVAISEGAVSCSLF
jgi:hypothetical protein